jgi:4-diphosphocytidyl-2-C-methyl-D-erythritol kinase
VTSVRASAPGKINLSLRIRGVREDGYHELDTVFHAVSLSDEVTVEAGAPGTGVRVTVAGEQVAAVPTDRANIAVRAAELMAERVGRGAPDLEIAIDKRIPVAGGMAGGSADAAATLIACRRLWAGDEPDLARIAAELGSDVPFALVGGTARGTGRGEIITPILTEGELHWVIALSDGELSTPQVYAEWDRLAALGTVRPGDGTDPDLLIALRHGDPRAIAPHLVNDLQPAAISLRPALAAVLDAGRDLGALAGIVSGSGPTCVFLAEDRERAIALAAELSGTGLVRGVRHAVGPAPGARVVA